MSTPGVRSFTRGLALLAIVALLAVPAAAGNGIYSTWKSLYPGSLTDDNVIAGSGTGCQVCHVSQNGGAPWNPYGWRIRQLITGGGFNFNTAILAVENENSDADPAASTNLEEIQANSQPGWTPGANNLWYMSNGTSTGGHNVPAFIQGFIDATWTLLPQGTLPGVFTAPSLAGTGPLTPGSPLSLNLGLALPSSPMWMIIGLSQIDAPFKGGTMVPDVDIYLPMMTSPGGSVSLPGNWPVGLPPGFDFWVQCWIADPGGPAGYTASNGLRGTSH